jgi:hypothetical protein
MDQRKKMIPPLATRDLAKRLLDHEASVGTTIRSAEPAGIRVYEKLRRSLCALAGVAGFHALASRALTLTKATAPGLGAVQISADGSLQGLEDIGPQADKNHGDEGNTVLIAQLLELLLIFIGESLTLSLVRDVWPEIAVDDAISETGEKKA